MRLGRNQGRHHEDLSLVLRNSNTLRSDLRKLVDKEAEKELSERLEKNQESMVSEKLKKGKIFKRKWLFTMTAAKGP